MPEPGTPAEVREAWSRHSVRRRRVAHRLVVVLAAGIAVQIVGWATLGGTLAAGVVVALGYAAAPLVGAAWVPRPPGGFAWRGTRRVDAPAALDRLWAVMTIGNVMAMQLMLLWLNEQQVALAARFGIVLTPVLLTFVVLEVRRRSPGNSRHAPSEPPVTDLPDQGCQL